MFIFNVIKLKEKIGFLDEVTILYGNEGVSIALSNNRNPVLLNDIIMSYRLYIWPMLNNMKHPLLYKEYVYFSYLYQLDLKERTNNNRSFMTLQYIFCHRDLLIFILLSKIQSIVSKKHVNNIRFRWLCK